MTTTAPSLTETNQTTYTGYTPHKRYVPGTTQAILYGTEGDAHRPAQTDPSKRAEMDRRVALRMSRTGTALCVCGD